MLETDSNGVYKVACIRCDVEGMYAGNIISISDSVADRLQKKLLPPVNVGIKVEDNVAVSTGGSTRK